MKNSKSLRIFPFAKQGYAWFGWIDLFWREVLVSVLSVSICFVIKTLAIFHRSDNLTAHRFEAPISFEALRQGTSYSLLASLAIW